VREKEWFISLTKRDLFHPKRLLFQQKMGYEEYTVPIDQNNRQKIHKACVDGTSCKISVDFGRDHPQRDNEVLLLTAVQIARLEKAREVKITGSITLTAAQIGKNWEVPDMDENGDVIIKPKTNQKKAVKGEKKKEAPTRRKVDEKKDDVVEKMAQLEVK
jgi:hypothetical protein